MIIRLHHDCLVVRDMDEVLRTFCDKLGMKLVSRRPGIGEIKESAFVEEPKTGHRIEFFLKHDGKESGKLDHIAFEVDDVYKEFKRLKDNGFKVDREPYDVPEVGVKLAFLRDSSGFRIQIIQFFRK